MSGRRIHARPIRLAGRRPVDVLRDVQDTLHGLQQAGDGGIPPGFKDSTPVDVTVGGTGSAGTEGAGWMAADAGLVVPTGAPATLGGASATGSTGRASDAGHIHDITGKPAAAGDIWTHDGGAIVRRSLSGDYCPVWVDPRESTKIGDGNRTPRGQPFEGTWYRGTTHIASGVAFPLFDVASPNAQDLMSFSLRYTAYWEDNGPSVQGEVGYVEVIAHRVGSVWAAGAVNMHDAKQSLSAGALTVAFTLDAVHDVAGAVDATKITVKATLTTTLGGTLVNAYLVWEMHDLFGPRAVTFAAMP